MPFLSCSGGIGTSDPWVGLYLFILLISIKFVTNNYSELLANGDVLRSYSQLKIQRTE